MNNIILEATNQYVQQLERVLLMAKVQLVSLGGDTRDLCLDIESDEQILQNSILEAIDAVLFLSQVDNTGRIRLPKTQQPS